MDPILRGFGYFFSPNGQAKNLLKNQMNEEKVSFHRGKMHFNSIENSSLVNHTWKWLPQTKEGEIKFEAVFKLTRCATLLTN